MEIKEGLLIGGDELFNHERYLNHYQFLLNSYIPNSEKPIAFFLSCSKYKPFYLSPYRRIFIAMLTKNLNIRDKSQLYTVSEPAIIIPEEFEDSIISKYDFPPEKLKEPGRRIFIDRLSLILPKLISSHEINFYILPKHHRSIFESALENIVQNTIISEAEKTLILSKVKYAPPVSYNLPKTKEIIIKTLKEKNFNLCL